MRLPEFAVRQPVATLMMLLAGLLLGLMSLLRLSIDMFPDISPPVVTILTTWPGASASDVETEVTKIIEDQVNAVSNLDSLTSKSLDNLSVVVCRFNWGTDLSVATNDIRDWLERAKRDLPPDVETPMLYKFSSATAPIFFITVTGETSWPRLYHLVDKRISDELKRVPGVGAIQLYGGLRRRINVYFDLEKVEAYRLSLEKVNEVLAAENVSIPAGSIKAGQKEYFVRVPARFADTKEMEQTVVGFVDGRPVYLRDIARVEDDFKPMELNGWGDGKPAIVLILQKQTGQNTVEVSRKVRAKIDDIQRSLPSDVRIHIVMETAENILTSIKNLRSTLYYGILLVILVTVAFLRQIRSALIIALSIPFSLILSFIFLFLFGYTINLISLMSLAIASGMVVDNGIVVLENIVRYMERGSRRTSAAMFGASEMGLAITASTLTTVVVFVPLMFLTGLAGIMFKQLGFVVVVTLGASLFTALTLTPMLCSQWLHRRHFQPDRHKGFLGRLYRGSEAAFQALERRYEATLAWALTYPKTTLFVACALFVSSLSLVPFLSTSFMPEVDSGDILVDFRLPEGTRIEETNRVVEAILENIERLVKPEEFRHSYAFAGQSEEGIGVALGFEEGANVGSIGFKLVDRDKRERSAKDIAALLRKEVVKIPGISRIMVSAQDPIAQILKGRGKAISLEIQGSDMDLLMDTARRIEHIFLSMDGLVDVEISQKPPRPELWVEIDREKAASVGLRVVQVAAILRNFFYGKEASLYRDAGDSFEIFTRLTEKDKDRLENLLRSPLPLPNGSTVQLKNFVTVREGSGPIEIERKNRQKIVKVEADLLGRSLGSASAELRERLSAMDLPEGVDLAFGGDVEEQQKAFRELTILFILGIVLVYMVMASLFGNLRDPLIIMFSVPFAVSGVLYAFYFTGTTLGVVSFMGVVMLVGIVVNNAIVLLDYTHLLEKRGLGLFEAVTQAGRNRLRPVLMTTLTTFFGMLPMAVSRSVGAETWNPLGITMLGGLSVSSAVTLIVVPTFYYLLEKRRRTAKSP
uniref:Efflux RND transporter permease subunit n=1 Tax=Desulfacinum infernum TaxID=35837 RepID=A0A832A389_9BACT